MASARPRRADPLGDHNSDELVGSTVDKNARLLPSLTEIGSTTEVLAVYASEVSTLRDEDRKRTLAIRAEVTIGSVNDRPGCGKEYSSPGSLTCRSRVTGMISFM